MTFSCHFEGYLQFSHRTYARDRVCQVFDPVCAYRPEAELDMQGPDTRRGVLPLRRILGERVMAILDNFRDGVFDSSGKQGKHYDVYR